MRRTRTQTLCKLKAELKKLDAALEERKAYTKAPGRWRSRSREQMPNEGRRARADMDLGLEGASMPAKAGDPGAERSRCKTLVGSH